MKLIYGALAALLNFELDLRVDIVNSSNENFKHVNSLFALFVKFHPAGVCPLKKILHKIFNDSSTHGSIPTHVDDFQSIFEHLSQAYELRQKQRTNLIDDGLCDAKIFFNQILTRVERTFFIKKFQRKS